jgi:hypothetical protein
MPKEILTTITASQAVKLAKHIAECAERLRGIGEIIEDEKFPSVQVAKWKQTNEGVEYMDTFISALRLALKKARQDRGDFPPPIPARRKKGRKKNVSDLANGSTEK